jgi:hypothetical protein
MRHKDTNLFRGADKDGDEKCSFRLASRESLRRSWGRIAGDCPRRSLKVPLDRLRKAISAVEYKRELIYFMFSMYEAGHNVDEMRQR